MAEPSSQDLRQIARDIIRRDRMFRQVLETLDPRPEDMDLDYPALLQRVLQVVQVEQRRALDSTP